MGAAVGGDRPRRVTSSPLAIPTTGMRGGLGRILLSAFLLMVILPLSLISLYTLKSTREWVEASAEQRLEAVAMLKAQTIDAWVERSVVILPKTENGVPRLPTEAEWQRIRREAPDLLGLRGEEGWERGRCEGATTVPIRLDIGGRETALCYRAEAVRQLLEEGLSQGAVGETGRLFLVQEGMVWPDETGKRRAEVSALQAGVNPDLYTFADGTEVFAAYGALERQGIGVLVEQDSREVMASVERVAATHIAVALGVALLTAVAASLITRKLIGPIIRLTEAALQIANGDFSRRVPVTSRDEIGILTYVFNQMAEELEAFYGELERKVVERTAELQRSNYKLQLQTLRWRTTLEIGQAIISWRDPDALMFHVASVIVKAFRYVSAAFYVVEEDRGVLRSIYPQPLESEGDTKRKPHIRPWPAAFEKGEASVLARACLSARPQREREDLEATQVWNRRSVMRIALPLKQGEKVIGVLGVLSAPIEGVNGGVDEEEVETLMHVANLVALALENARAYESERTLAQRLQAAELFKSRFLANMSHDLREPLNTIIGFSRLLIKGVDGALTPEQLEDIERIHDNSRHLLQLFDDILTISQIQAGVMDLEMRPVNIAALIDSIWPTAVALVRGEKVRLLRDVPDDLPPALADEQRIRQALLHLLGNAAKFTEEGWIFVRAWAEPSTIYVSVADTGPGIPPSEQERIFDGFEKGKLGHRYNGIGLGLVISRRFIEMHGGRLWLQSEVGKGSTFTFSLPRYRPNREEREGKTL